MLEISIDNLHTRSHSSRCTFAAFARTRCNLNFILYIKKHTLCFREVTNHINTMSQKARYATHVDKVAK